MYAFLSCTMMEYKYNRINMLDSHLSENQLQDKGELKGFQLLLFSQLRNVDKVAFLCTAATGTIKLINQMIKLNKHKGCHGGLD